MTTGDDVLKLFTYAREKQFAIPACNVTSSRFVRTPPLPDFPAPARMWYCEEARPNGI